MDNGYGNPSLEVMDGVIGGPVHATVTGPGGQQVMTSVTWTVTGAMESQTYQNSVGETTPLSGSVTHDFGGGSTGIDIFSPYWNTTVGQHTVSVSVTYNDGSTGTASVTVNVAQPTVNQFGVIYGPTVWVVDENNIGIGFESHMTYSASVTAPWNGGGQFMVIQTVNMNNSEINQTIGSGQATHTATTPGVVLDNIPNMTQPTDPGYPLNGSQTQLSGGNTASLPAGLEDAPFSNWKWDQKTEVGTLDLRMDVTFKDYLVYQASGGIWVQIAETPSYTESGEEKYIGPFDGTGHWEQAAPPSPAQAMPKEGNPSLGFVDWDDYVTPYLDWKPSVT